MSNLTIVTEFILMDIKSSWELQVVQGLLFLVVYLGALTGNLLTVTVRVTDPRLNSPMYYFISNLSLIGLCYVSVTVPKFIANSLADNKSISLTACAAQIFLFIFLSTTDFAFLVVMSCDHCVAFCHPLHYGLIITPHMCTQAAGGCWACGLVYSAIHTGTIFRLPFTQLNVIYQYFCDVSQILRLSSSDVQYYEFVVLAVGICIAIVCSVLLFLSYINIFSTVLSMNSMEAHNKALSTCTPQLAVLLIFAISGVIDVLSPSADKASLSSLLTGMFYPMVPPVINPLIYSLQNREINTALGRMFNRCFEFPTRVFYD
ncbi:olfactory receptor 14I1-like [Dasypus novemcinctus]|uniref:olfactory receptor 14I1-like n=1 Tax=Dasypus novemcinctus TaxID=9361 RepID=UPI0003291545|nr:olfactory receptor 14I1-like [Dasypus novemcinctus]